MGARYGSNEETGAMARLFEVDAAPVGPWARGSGQFHREGWTYWGLEAGVGPQVLPLDFAWPTRRAQATNAAQRLMTAWPDFERNTERILAGLDEMQALCLGEATANCRKAVAEARALLGNAARALRRAAGNLPEEVVPLGDRRDWPNLLRVNALQKNAVGLCAIPGCRENAS